MKIKVVSLLLLLSLSSCDKDKKDVANNSICKKKCNIILISVDSLVRNHLGTYGYKRNTSPYIDVFAEHSWKFENYFSTGYLTPVSELSVHTGLFPDRTSSKEFIDYKKVKTLGDILKDNGYATYAYGNSPEFDMVKSYKDILGKAFAPIDYNIKHRLFNERQLEWDKIDQFVKNNSDRPLFLWFPLGSAHAPFGYKLPNRFADKNYAGAFNGIQFYANMQFYYDGKVYDPRDERNRFNIYFFAGTNSDMHVLDQFIKGPFPKTATREDFKFINDIYDNGVSQVDLEVGKIIRLLKDNKIFSNSIIVLQSEHGETLGERKYIAHSDIYDELVHQPFILHFPGNTPKIFKDELVSGIDILPTLLDMLGLTFNDYALDGKSFVSVQNKGVHPDFKRQDVFHVRTPLWESLMAVKDRKSIFDELRAYQKSSGNDLREYAIRTDNYKLIHRRARFIEMQYSAWTYVSGKKLEIPEYEWFDIKKDPLELTPLKPEGPVFNELRDRLLKFEKNARANGIKSPYFEIQDYR